MNWWMLYLNIYTIFFSFLTHNIKNILISKSSQIWLLDRWRVDCLLRRLCLRINVRLCWQVVFNTDSNVSEGVAARIRSCYTRCVYFFFFAGTPWLERSRMSTRAARLRSRARPLTLCLEICHINCVVKIKQQVGFAVSFNITGSWRAAA